MVDAPTIIGALEDAGYRLTSPRRSLATAIAARPGHFTAEELLRESGGRHAGVTRATVFRTLDVLTELGIVERLDLPTGEHAFVACEAEHHHHIVCSSCGQSTWVADAGLERAATTIGEQTGYRIDAHRLELFGLCPDCQRA